MIRPVTYMFICAFSFLASAQDRPSLLNLGLKPRSITVDGRERTYRVVVPPRVTEPMPLVLVLHGGGAGEIAAQQVIGYTQFTGLALREKFIVVYPVGVDGNWNDGRKVEFIRAQKEDIDDIKFLRSVIDEIAKQHRVDRSRIFSTGISNGAIMSNRLAAEASDLVAAIAPVVGGMSVPVAERFSPKYPVSVMIIQGDSDPLVPIDGGAIGRRATRERGRVVSTRKLISMYLKSNGIKDTPTVSMISDADPDDGTTTTASIYGASKEGFKVHFLLVENGGHTWPGKRQYLPERVIGKTSNDFDGTRKIWEFFKSCPPRRHDRDD